MDYRNYSNSRLLGLSRKAKRRCFSCKKKTAKAQLYQDQINTEIDSLMQSNDEASMPVLDSSKFGYKPVKGECLLAIQDDVYRQELRSTGRNSSQTISISIPIAQGIKYRAQTNNITGEKQYQKTAGGRLLVTNKAIVFEGDTRNDRITWGQITKVQLASDGYEIQKRSGKPFEFIASEPDPKFAAIIHLMLNKAV